MAVTETAGTDEMPQEEENQPAVPSLQSLPCSPSRASWAREERANDPEHPPSYPHHSPYVEHGAQ